MKYSSVKMRHAREVTFTMLVRAYATASKTETVASNGKAGLKAADIANRLRSEKEKQTNDKNEVGDVCSCMYISFRQKCLYVQPLEFRLFSFLSKGSGVTSSNQSKRTQTVLSATTICSSQCARKSSLQGHPLSRPKHNRNK